MLDQIYIGRLRQELTDYALKRRQIIKESGDALHHAKRAIFALHRGNQGEATAKLAEAKGMLHAIEQRHKKEPLLLHEGSYHAALEEYVEATLLHDFVAGKKMAKIMTPRIDGDIYLAGLCDVPGELYRLAIKAATARDMQLVKHCAEAADEIIGALIEFDLTSYLRTKFDQAKQANHKLEQVVYEVSLREN